MRRAVCFFIPPYVLKPTAREGVEASRLSLLQSRRQRLTRRAKVVEFEVLAGASGPGQGQRRVYDSQNTWDQQVKLVRGESDAAIGDSAADQVFDSAGVVRDYCSSVLGRNSIDNQGMDLVLNVHYGQHYMNAFWDGDEMTFGDGDGTIFSNFAASLDVVAHELAHGITQHTADLAYEGQSGALNEHFSDVFGSAIQQHANQEDAGKADWLIGDEIMGPELYGEALRSMKAPGSAYNSPIMGGPDPQPAHMRDIYTGTDDNGGVHINSGIPNKAFYLVATSIGTNKAVAIWHQALQKLWPTAKFNDAVEVIVDTARQLVKEQVAPRGSTQTVRLAFKEVGLPS